MSSRLEKCTSSSKALSFNSSGKDISCGVEDVAVDIEGPDSSGSSSNFSSVNIIRYDDVCQLIYIPCFIESSYCPSLWIASDDA